MIMSNNKALSTEITPSYHRAWSVQFAEHKGILLLVDGILVFTALWLGLWLGAQRSGWEFSWQLMVDYSPWFVGMMILYFILAAVNDAYRPKIATDAGAGVFALFKTIAGIFVLYLLLYALVPYPYTLPRHFTGFFALIALVLLLGWRRLYSLAFTMPAFQRRAIIIGAGWAGKTIVKTLRDFAPTHFEVVGFVDDDPAKQHLAIDDVPVLGPTTNLVDLAQKMKATDVVLAISHDVPGEILARVLSCYEQGLKISTMPDLYESFTDRVPVEHTGDNWYVMLPLNGQGQNLSYRLAKRGLDLLIALPGLVNPNRV
jgi:FlaA1/EpsC-like NDP-sugar epimerase